MSVFLSVSLLT